MRQLGLEPGQLGSHELGHADVVGVEGIPQGRDGHLGLLDALLEGGDLLIQCSLRLLIPGLLVGLDSFQKGLGHGVGGGGSAAGIAIFYAYLHQLGIADLLDVDRSLKLWSREGESQRIDHLPQELWRFHHLHVGLGRLLAGPEGGVGVGAGVCPVVDL